MPEHNIFLTQNQKSLFLQVGFGLLQSYQLDRQNCLVKPFNLSNCCTPKVSCLGCFLYNLLLILLYDCDIIRASLQRCGFGAFKSLYQVGAKAS